MNGVRLIMLFCSGVTFLGARPYMRMDGPVRSSSSGYRHRHCRRGSSVASMCQQHACYTLEICTKTTVYGNMHGDAPWGESLLSVSRAISVAGATSKKSVPYGSTGWGPGSSIQHGCVSAEKESNGRNGTSLRGRAMCVYALEKPRPFA